MPAETPAKQCDEYPFRASVENNITMSLRKISAAHNLREGQRFGNMLSACGHYKAWSESDGAVNKPFVTIPDARDIPITHYLCSVDPQSAPVRAPEDTNPE
jgi:hypothetical protein